jgi:hypothetical protein
MDRGSSCRYRRAIVALVGWAILELIVLWVIGIFGRRSAAATV